MARTTRPSGFKVNDGLVETNSDYLMTVNVTPVNDAPTVTKALEDQDHRSPPALRLHGAR